MKTERLLRMTILVLCGTILIDHRNLDVTFWMIVLIVIIHSLLLVVRWEQ